MSRILFTDGVIHPMTDRESVFSCMEVKDGVISGLYKSVPETYGGKTVSLGGKHVYPCLIDGHLHMLLTVAVMAMGFSVCSVTGDGVKPDTMRGVEQRLRDYAEKLPSGAVIAANNYIIVAPNRRGLNGFGNEWNEQISGDYGGQCMRDYLSAIDEFVASEPYVDKDHLGCVGASFGGFSVYWLAGHHDKRFKAFIAHDGIFNMEQQYLETEEMWFANWDMGGAYWNGHDKTFKNSPHRFVDKWDTPILCIQGEKDYRIVTSQAMSAFNAAQLRGIPSEFLCFPDENHWVLKPQNGILWQRRFFNWLDRYVK